jgi:DNA-binding protein YbaB
MTAPRRPIGDLGQLQQQAGELDARLAAARHTARAADGLVTAVVTGQGKLVDLRIEDRALHGPAGQKLGLVIVQTIKNARDTARASSLPELNALFGKEPPKPPEPEPQPEWVPYAEEERPEPSSPPPPPARAPRRPDFEENFEEIDFLTDDEPETGRGHW